MSVSCLLTDDSDLPYPATPLFDLLCSESLSEEDNEEHWAANLLMDLAKCILVSGESYEDAEDEDEETVSRAPSFKRKRETYRSAHATWKRDILKEWFLQHAATSRGPYPSEHEKRELARSTNLTVKQIETFFSNNRRTNRGMWTKSDREEHKRRREKGVVNKITLGDL